MLFSHESIDTAIGTDMDKAWAIVFKMIVIRLFGTFAGENISQIALVRHHDARQFEVFKNGGEHACDAEVDAVLESRQIHHHRLALCGVRQQFVHTLTLWLCDGIERTKQHDVALVDARPHHIEAVGIRIYPIVHNLIVSIFAEEDGGKLGRAICVAVDRSGGYLMAIEEIHDDVAHTVGATFAAKCDRHACHAQ